ncbi:BgTH12-06176 [Blumeria graminis f. sp. triticale]|uniref:Bgt-50068 n=2 Tax=Blumeria graminis TaxID=34373 RepID=A0A9X9QF12_BLUGR|nr:BgTH12-06176 [Blumeria graminis f. sp. triticale]VDB91325.1 Bgt-50068 [Blumeria graminis f. sp. tritici]
MLEFFEIESSSSRVDGPWKKAFLTKKTSEYFGSLNVRYEIVVNNHREACGIVIRHRTRRKIAAANYPDKEVADLPNLRIFPEKQIIRIMCIFQQTFPLIPPKVSKSLKRKAPSQT